MQRITDEFPHREDHILLIAQVVRKLTYLEALVALVPPCSKKCSKSALLDAPTVDKT